MPTGNPGPLAAAPNRLVVPAGDIQPGRFVKEDINESRAERLSGLRSKGHQNRKPAPVDWRGRNSQQERYARTDKDHRRNRPGRELSLPEGSAMTMLEHALAHPWLASFVALPAALFVIWMCLTAAGTLASRALRSINIALRGWPPSHLDADGDWKPEEDEE